MCKTGYLLFCDIQYICICYYFQILAIYKEQDMPPIPHNSGNSTSASLVGTSSDILCHNCVYIYFQLLAIYEELDLFPLPHNSGDSTSASSVGTSSHLIVLYIFLQIIAIYEEQSVPLYIGPSSSIYVYLILYSIFCFYY